MLEESGSDGCRILKHEVCEDDYAYYMMTGKIKYNDIFKFLNVTSVFMCFHLYANFNINKMFQTANKSTKLHYNLCTFYSLN